MTSQKNEQRFDEQACRQLLIFVERLVRDGTPEHEIVRQVEELLDGQTTKAAA